MKSFRWSKIEENLYGSSTILGGIMELNNKIYKKVISLSERGEACVDREEYDDAIRLFLNALEYIPEPKYEWEASTWLYTALGDVSYFDGNYDNAINYLNEAMKCPNGIGNAFILLRLGESYYEINDFEKAKDYFIQAYMCDGSEIFEDEDDKYKELIANLL